MYADTRTHTLIVSQLLAERDLDDRMISVSDDGSLFVRQSACHCSCLEQGSITYVVNTRTRMLKVDSFVHSNVEIAVSLGKNDIRIYQKLAGQWKLIHSLTEHLSRVLAIDWAPKTNQIVSASAVRTPFTRQRSRTVRFIQDYNAYVWTLENDVWKPQMVELQRTNRAVCCAKWSPEGSRVVQKSSRTINSFVVRILENKFAIGSSDKNVAICYYEKEQRFWAAEMIKKKPKSTVTCIAWHPNNQLLAVGSCDYRCRLEKPSCQFSKSIFLNSAEFTRPISKQSMDKQKHPRGEASPKSANFFMSYNQVYCSTDLQRGGDSLRFLESGWIHDVAFSQLGDNIAWVSHNSIIFAVSANNPSRSVRRSTQLDGSTE